MIQNRTARELMFSWHGGQFSPLYAAASSGLVASWDALLQDCKCMENDLDCPQDYAKLTEWINVKRSKQKHEVVIRGQAYAVLPWVSRSY